MAGVTLRNPPCLIPHFSNARSWNRGLANADLDRALKDANTLIRRAGLNPACLDTRALIELRRKDYPAAIADETAAIDKMPKMAPASYVRGLTRRASGDAPGATADIAAARAAQPDIDLRYAANGLAAPGAALRSGNGDEDDRD